MGASKTGISIVPLHATSPVLTNVCQSDLLANIFHHSIAPTCTYSNKIVQTSPTQRTKLSMLLDLCYDLSKLFDFLMTKKMA